MSAEFQQSFPLTPPVADFTGRETDLESLRNKSLRTVSPIVIQGVGGAGKTQLARKLAGLLKPDYPDAQFELDLKGTDPKPLTPDDLFAAVFHAFNPAVKLPERLEERTPLLRQSLDGKRVLLLLDNAKDAHQIKPILPPPRNCLIVVTSQYPLTLPGLDPLDLGPMTPADARALLLKIAPRIGDYADALAEACHRLPLALRLAATLIAVHSVNPAHYIQHLRNAKSYFRQLRIAPVQFNALTPSPRPSNTRTTTESPLSESVPLAAHEPPSATNKTRPSVGEACVEPDFGARDTTRLALIDQALPIEASFNLSFNQLSPEDQARLTLLAVFPASFDRTAADAVLGTPDSATSLDTFARLSLLDCNLESQRFALHHQLRDFARAQAKPDDLEAALRRHALHFIQVGQRADELYDQAGDDGLAGLALFDRERPHIEAAFDWLQSSLTQHSAPLLVSLVDAVVYTSSLRFAPRQRICWLEAQLEAARLAGDRAGEANALGNLGLTHADLGQAPKAIQFYDQALAIDRDIGNPRGEATGLWNSALAFDFLNDRSQAIARAQAALKLYEAIHDPNAAQVRDRLIQWTPVT